MSVGVTFECYRRPGRTDVVKWYREKCECLGSRSGWMEVGIDYRPLLLYLNLRNSSNSGNGKVFLTLLAVKPDPNGFQMIYNLRFSHLV